MKLEINRNDLLSALQSVIGVVERRQTMPVLSNLLLKAQADTLVITATDLELELVARLSVSVEQAGATTVPARKLLDICRGLPDSATMVLTMEEQRMRVTSGRSRFLLATLPADEFPVLDELAATRQVEISQKTLKQLIDRTHFAMAQQDVRYYLNGLLLVIANQRIRAVATDGHRLALSDAQTQTDNDEPIRVIVPRKAITEVLRLLDASDASIQLMLSDRHLQIALPDLQFTTKLIDGTFPDYERVIPEAGDKIVSGDRETLSRALARTAILSNEKFKGVRLVLAANSLTLQAQNPNHEEAEDEVAVDYSEEPMEIGFNVNYLMDALAVMDAERFVLELSGPDNSGLIHEDGDESSKYVVMPMRL